MIKKKLNILFFILLLGLFLGSFSTSYAMSKSEAFEYCRDNCGFASLFNAPNNNNGTSLLTYNNFLTYLDDQTNNYMYVRKIDTNSSNTYFDILFFDSFSIENNSYRGTNNSTRYGAKKSCYSFNNYYDTKGYTQSSNGLTQGTFPTAANTFYMVYGDEQILAASFDLPVTNYFEPNHDYKVVVNSYNDVNCLLRNWSIYQWNIGNSVNFIDLQSYSMYLYDLKDNVEIGYVFANNSQGTMLNNGALFYNTDGELYVNSRLISHNVLYRLFIEKWADGVDSSEEYYFIFLPTNAVVSNGQIINIGSGDFNVQDSTNNIIDNVNDTEAFENIMDELSQSGEVVKRLNYKKYPNHSYDILFALTKNICDSLFDSGDTYIDVDIHNYSHRFYASDFYIPTNSLTVWIQMAVVFGYCYLLYKQTSELIHAIQEGDLFVLELEDANEYFYM